MTSALFVNPPSPGFRKITRNVDCASESKGNYLLQPFDFLLLSGRFSMSDRLDFIDAVSDRLASAACFERIQGVRFDLLITAVIDATWENDLAFLSTLRKTYPAIPILVFGDALLEEANVTMVMELADGVITSPLLFNPSAVQNWSRAEVRARWAELGLRAEGPFISPSKVPELMQLTRPRHELFRHVSYRWPFASHKQYTTVITSWGCPYSCDYCTASKLPSLYRDSSEVLEELRGIQRLGIREVYYGDKSFGVPSRNTRLILQGMVDEGMGFAWSSYFHPNQYTPELLELMKRSGCHTLIIGIESKDIGSLVRYGRKSDRVKTEALIEHANRLRINVCGDFIFGLPDEGEDEMAATLDYALSLKLDYASFNIASPLPGSIIKSLAVQDGRMRPDEHHFDAVGMDRILPSNRVSAEALRTIRNRAVRRFYLRPGYLLRRILRLRGVEHFTIQMAEMFEILKKARSPL